MILWDWTQHLAEQYWPIVLTVALMATLLLIATHNDKDPK